MQMIVHIIAHQKKASLAAVLAYADKQLKIKLFTNVY